MPREVIESARIVVKTEAGNRVECNAKGDPAKVIVNIFPALSAARRQALLDELQEAHFKLPPCMECGAATKEEAETKCRCGGDKDDCLGTSIWPEA